MCKFAARPQLNGIARLSTPRRTERARVIRNAGRLYYTCTCVPVCVCECVRARTRSPKPKAAARLLACAFVPAAGERFLGRVNCKLNQRASVGFGLDWRSVAVRYVGTRCRRRRRRSRAVAVAIVDISRLSSVSGFPVLFVAFESRCWRVCDERGAQPSKCIFCEHRGCITWTC